MKLNISGEKLQELVSQVRAKMAEFIPSVYEPMEVVASDVEKASLGQKDEFGRFTIKLQDGVEVKASLFRGTKEGLDRYDLALCKNVREIKISQGALAGTVYPKGDARAFRLMEPK